jgi:hypothetical protein
MKAIKSCNSKLFLCIQVFEGKKERKFVSSTTIALDLTVACQCSSIELASVRRLTDSANTLQCV